MESGYSPETIERVATLLGQNGPEWPPVTSSE